MSEYSPRPGTVRSYDERAEFDEPCTRNRIGSGVSPVLGVPTRLRQRLSATSPFLAQYSALQITPSLPSPAPVLCACAVKADASPAPTPRLAPLRIVRRARACSGDIGLSVIASSDLGASALGGRALAVCNGYGPRSYQSAERAGRWQNGNPAAKQANLSQHKPSRASPHFATRFRTIGSNARAVPLQRGIGNQMLQRRYGGKVPGRGLTRRAMELRPPNREHRVLEALHRAAVFCDQRIGWNRIGVALSLTIIAVAAVVLYRILRTIDAGEVVEALVTVNLRDVTLAALFVAGGYLTLTFYDLFALRTIGRTDVPYWAAALAAFTSYSVGHNVGASVFTGGAVRYRVYSGWVWRRPRIVGRDTWSVNLPGGPLTLLQIGLGILDLCFCALAMYMLVPDEPNIGFVTLAVIFVSATLLGFASHAPGGIGVFDAAMLVALWQFDKEDVLAGLLLFRLLYYIVPFALSLLVLGGRELVLAVRGASPPPLEPIPSLVPTEVATSPEPSQE